MLISGVTFMVPRSTARDIKHPVTAAVVGEKTTKKFCVTQKLKAATP